MEHFLGVGEHTRVARERSIRGVPTGRTETGAQINQRVAGQPPLTECLCLGEYFIAASECALRMRSVDPRRSNCWPPSPRPSNGEFPVGKQTRPVSLSTVNCWILSPFAVSMVNMRGSIDSLMTKSADLTVWGPFSSRTLIIGMPQDDLT